MYMYKKKAKKSLVRVCKVEASSSFLFFFLLEKLTRLIEARLTLQATVAQSFEETRVCRYEHV